MGAHRKRRRREERLEEEEEQQGREPAQESVLEKERPQEREREATPADRVLDLQKTAGNRATNAAISRWGFPWLPATAAPQWPKEPQVILDGTVIPIVSWSWNDRSAGVGSGTGLGKLPEIGREISISTTVGSHSADLGLRAAEGRPFKTVYLVVPGKDGKGVTIKLEDVLITGYQISGGSAGSEPVDTWSLSYAKRELTQAPPPRH